MGHYHNPEGGADEPRGFADCLRSHAGGGIPEHKAAWRLGAVASSV